MSTTKWTRPFQLGTTPGAYWQTAAASKSRGWAVLDGLGTLSSAWNEDSGHARYTMVCGMGGSQTPRIQNADTLLRVTPPKYRTTPGGLGVLGWSRPASTSAIEVVRVRKVRWAVAYRAAVPAPSALRHPSTLPRELLNPAAGGAHIAVGGNRHQGELVFLGVRRQHGPIQALHKKYFNFAPNGTSP